MTISTQHIAERVVKNTAAQVIAMASTVVSKLLITIIIGRLFGAERVGDYAAVMTFSLLFTFLASAGLHWSLIRETATHRDDIHRYAGNSFTLVIITGLLTIPIMVGTAALLGYGRELLVAVGLAALALMVDCLALVLGSVFNGLERMELGAAIIIVQELTFLLLGGLVLLLRLPFLWLFVVYIPSRLAGLLSALYLYRRVLSQSLRIRFDIPFIRSLLRISAPYAANMALGPIYLRIDILMLSYYQGSVAVGLYEAGTSIFYRFNIVARMFNNALMPLLAREYETETDRIHRYLKAATKYQTAVGMPLMVLCLLLGGRIITLIYGPDFVDSGIVFSLLATIITLRFLDNTLAMMLTAVNMQTQRSLIVALAAVINVSLNLYFVPQRGFLGATITTIITEICFFAGLYLVLSRRVPQPMPWKLLIRPSLAAGVMGLTIWSLANLPLLIIIILAGAVYLAVLIVSGEFSSDEWLFLLRVSQLHRLTTPLHRRLKLLEHNKSIPGGK